MTETAKKTAAKTAAKAPTAKAAEPVTLRAPFPDEAIGKLPRVTCRACREDRTKVCQEHRRIRCQECGQSHTSAAIHLDYVGHADVTDRLLAVDPTWTWRHFTLEEMQALPPALREAGLWIHLTVNGVTRPGFGDAGDKRGPNAVKEAIGDALRNAAMRFGVALDLWAKGDRSWAEAKDETPEAQEAPQEARTAPPAAQAAQEAPQAAQAPATEPQQASSGKHGPPSDPPRGNANALAAFWKEWEGLSETQQKAAQETWPWPGIAPDALDPRDLALALQHAQKVAEDVPPF